VPPERVGHPALLDLGEVVALAHIVQAAQLHHEVVQPLPPGADHGEAVVPAVEVEEVELVGRETVVADAKAQQVAVEGQQRLHVLDVQHGVAHAERPGAEA
jgi:hypothetical protein